MDIPVLYGALAHLFPELSPPGDYAEEAKHWRDALRAHLGPGRHRILELGVGGGHNLSHMTSEFDATAVDLSPAMLEMSRRLNPTVEHHVGDMRSVRLRRTFDAVIVHDAISYMATEDDLRAAFATVVAHLRPGGVFVCAPDLYTETFHGPTATVHGPRGRDGHVTFFEYEHDPDPSDTTMEALFFVVVRGERGVEVHQDRHILGLFPLATWTRLLSEAGFRVEQRPYPVHPDGRDAWLLVGTL